MSRRILPTCVKRSTFKLKWSSKSYGARRTMSAAAKDLPCNGWGSGLTISCLRPQAHAGKEALKFTVFKLSQGMLLEHRVPSFPELY